MFGNLEIANGTQNTLSKIELRNNRAGAENFNFLCSFLAKSNSPTDDENRITFEAEYHRLMKLKMMRIRELNTSLFFIIQNFQTFAATVESC